MKTIYEQLEEETQALEAEQPEVVEVVEEVIEPEETVPDDTEEPEKVDPVEEYTPEVKPDPVDFIKMRQELKAVKDQQAQIAREANEAAQRAMKVNQQEQDPEPNKAEDREEWLEWKVRQADKAIERAQKFIEQEEKAREHNNLIQGAIQEFTGYENRFKLKAPDYDQAANHYREKVRDSIATLNPGLDAQQVDQVLARQLLQQGSTFVNQGLDPAEAIYNIAKKMGYTFQEPKKEPVKTPKPSLETVEKNKSKSANGLGAGGGKSNVTIAALEKASIADMYDMSDEEINGALYSR